MYEDETLVCRDCGQEFVFSASEQAFFAEKGFMNKPSRCPKCRAARRAQNGNGLLQFPGAGHVERQRFFRSPSDV